MLYVIAQFFFLVVLAWPIDNLHFSILGLFFILLGIVIAIFAIFSNPPGNFNVRPIPKKTGELITTGIYHYIRHPMYSSLFSGGFGVVLCQFSWWKLVAWILLVITLHFKARFEERSLLLHYSGYLGYKNSNKAFIPYIW
jgi:protein-S-isoprenylcysteine O-methyltransferase Ste14